MLFVVLSKFVLQEDLNKCRPRVSYKEVSHTHTHTRIFLEQSDCQVSFAELFSLSYLSCTSVPETVSQRVCIRASWFLLISKVFALRFPYLSFKSVTKCHKFTCPELKTDRRTFFFCVSTRENLYYSKQGLALSFHAKGTCAIFLSLSNWC